MNNDRYTSFLKAILKTKDSKIYELIKHKIHELMKSNGKRRNWDIY